MYSFIASFLLLPLSLFHASHLARLTCQNQRMEVSKAAVERVKPWQTALSPDSRCQGASSSHRLRCPAGRAHRAENARVEGQLPRQKSQQLVDLWQKLTLSLSELLIDGIAESGVAAARVLEARRRVSLLPVLLTGARGRTNVHTHSGGAPVSALGSIRRRRKNSSCMRACA